MGGTNLWDAEWEVNEEQARMLIGRQFPQLSSKQVKRLGWGWDNTVFLIGDEYVFRFPRRTIAVGSIRMEGELLPKLEAYMTIPYPKPLFYGEASDEYPVPFLGYTYVPGDFPIGLTEERRALSAETLAKFLRRLHEFPVQTALKYGVQQDHRNLTDIASRKVKLEGFLKKMVEHLSSEESGVIEAYISSLQKARVEAVNALLHGDLHFKNMLVNENGIVSGIIDWGDLSVGHPACDLSIAYSFLPPYARGVFFETYGGANEETKLLARLIAVYIPVLIFMQAVDDGNAAIAAEAKSNIMRSLSN
ncbi:aminoglycoside phosphotransferase (APT) family kinase protein [Paenibacillus sp. SORGH_AS306]|uniref:phosphotransferase n=1 Tax=unclassified Paenibacillus TaxID=185978 RepID=UPI002788C5FE|nr:MULTISPECIES: phosphotransferase [unclassified Paenibacillus]MDQ1234206.1 aminoglycoside phosphotransferase (APT) family kinase protein [Paenibacillus sp. SORGH_AS_0306]MDR6111251.1 aminoglycoside phosphotransferase (APT) family kinase protein [Paenibacillus sp. SORGH_AS_0338]